MEPLLGIYEAICTDNSDFFHTGKIKVRVQGVYNGRIDWDLSANYNKEDFNKKLADDLDCLVQSGVGGGLNHGAFALPQINSVGTVQFLGGNVKKSIWTGAYFKPEYNDQGEAIRVNIPNDNPFAEGNGADGINKKDSDAEAQKRILGDFGTIIFRQKKTSAPGNTTKGEDNMNWNKQRSQNLIVIDGDEIKITHFSKWDESDDKETGTLKQWEDVIIGTHKVYNDALEVVEEYPEIVLAVSDIDDNDKTKTTSIVVNNEKVGFTVIDEAKNMKSEITADNYAIQLKSRNTDNGDNTMIQQTPEAITIQNKTANAWIGQDDVAISAPKGKLRLSGAEVILGQGGGYILTKDDPLPMRMEDGTILKTSAAKA